MYHLKKCGGTFKGIIGECLFKCTDYKAILTKFMNKYRFLSIFGNKISLEQKKFVMNYWFSLDAVKIEGEEIIIYEIKTLNKYSKDVPFKPKMTLSTSKIYNLAKSLGFSVKAASVWLYENWEFDVLIKEFDSSDYYIDAPKQYDRRVDSSEIP